MRILRYIPAGLLFLCTVAVVWTGLLLPPPFWIVKYGLTPGCEPTGRTWTIEGVEFVEIGRGISRTGSDGLARRGKYGYSVGNSLGRLARPVGIAWGEGPVPSGEMPVHWTEFPRGFAISRYEVTNAQFRAFDSAHKRSGSSPGDRDPVVKVSWEEAKAYCSWLANRSGREVRLPDEAEWEAACRSGSPDDYCFGEEAARLDEYAWFSENSKGRAHEVGSRKPNAWALYDLHGNVWEWCGDPWSAGSPFRVMRGGSIVNVPLLCRSALRIRFAPQTRWDVLGFRPAFTPPDR